MHFHAQNGAKRVRRSQQHGAAHARTNIDKGICVDGRNCAALPPANDHAVKDRWSNAEIGGDMPVVSVAGAQVAPGNQAAGAHSKLQVKGMAN